MYIKSIKFLIYQKTDKTVIKNQLSFHSIIVYLAIFTLFSNWYENGKIRLLKTLAFPIATYGTESWTLNAACRRRIEAFEMTSFRRMLRIPWTAHRTNISILQELKLEPKDHLLSTVQRQILKFFGHIVRSDGIKKLVIQGKVDGKRSRGRSPMRFIDQVKSFTNLPMEEVMRTAEDREVWRWLSSLQT